MVMSTRRSAESDTTRTPFGGAAKALAARAKPAAAETNSNLLCIDLTPSQHLLRLVVEGHLHTSLDSGHVHAQCDGMAVARFNRRVRCLARAHALHPVAHIR